MSDNTYIKCQSAYSKLSANTLHDLGEILEKLECQKKAIMSANLENNSTQIIDSINDSISSLKSIINATNYSTRSARNLATNIAEPQPYTYSENRADSISNFMESNSTQNTPKLADPNSNSKPNKSSAELENTPVPSDNIPPSNTKEKKANIFSRGCPQQGSIITRLLSQLQINKGISTTQAKTVNTDFLQHSAHSIHSAIINNKSSTLYYPKHNIPEPCHHTHPLCTPEKDILSRQIDIVRLLILYLQLRPHYPYCYRICSIANTQFDILSTLINI